MKQTFKTFLYSQKADIMPIIKELTETEWHTGKRVRTEAVKKLLKIAESDEVVGRAYMKALNKAAKTIGESCMKRVNEGYFSIKKQRKLSETGIVPQSGSEIQPSEAMQAKE
jgi:predicted nucleotidyltransferase